MVVPVRGEPALTQSSLGPQWRGHARRHQGSSVIIECTRKVYDRGYSTGILPLRSNLAVQSSRAHPPLA